VKLAIMGGTFNPPHLGHLICAEESYDHYKFDKLLFIPNARPPHKNKSNVVEPQHRYMMTVLAVRDNPHFEVSRIELDRPGNSYSIETVKELKSRYGPGMELYWIIGADSVLEMSIWKNVDELLDICNFIAINRPGYDLNKADQLFLRRLQIFEVTNVDISASKIRKRVREGKSIKYLVPSPVEEYIYKNGLYSYACDKED
jgi:nicotinate-nucleotide adenylyltransferase